MRVPKTFLFCGLIFCSCTQAPNNSQHSANATPVIEYKQPNPATIALIDSLRSVIDSLTGNTPVETPPTAVAVIETIPEPIKEVAKTVPPIQTSLSSPNDPFNKMSLSPASANNRKVAVEGNYGVPDETTSIDGNPNSNVNANANANSNTGKGGFLSFPKNNYDYGQIKEGKQIFHTFYFKNTGKKPISILSADVTCGCTTPTFPKRPIRPGESGKIDIHYNSDGKMASQHSVVTLYTDGAPSFKELHLRGYVMPIWDDEKPSKKPATTPKPEAKKPATPKPEETKAVTPEPETSPTPKADPPKPEPKPEEPKVEPKEEAPKDKVNDEDAPGINF